jgi:hypothetical protein
LVKDGDFTDLPHGDIAKARPWLRTVRTVLTEGGIHGSVEGIAPLTEGGSHRLEPVLESESMVIAGEPRTDEELAYVRRVYERTGSKTRTCKEIWGYKNRDSWSWLNRALSEMETPS